MLKFLVQSFKSQSRRRKQVGRLVAHPAQTFELKQMLSGVQVTVDAPDQPQAGSEQGQVADGTSQSTVATPVVVNSAMLSRNVTPAASLVSTAFGIRPIATSLVPRVSVAPRISLPAIPVVSRAALSPLATQAGAVNPLASSAVRPIQPIVPPTTAVTVAPQAPADDHGNDAATATVVASPSTTDGHLHQGDSDWFRLEIKKGQTYTIRTELLTLANSTLRIRDAQGNSLKFDDDGGTGFASSLTWTATEDSTIYIDVRAYSSTQTGTYKLHISSESSPGHQTTTNVTTTTTTRFFYTVRRVIWIRR